MYKIHNEEGSIQDMTTMQVFPSVKENREGRKYLNWLAEGNKPLPMDPPPVLVVDENEEKIKAEIRKVAIASLIAKEGLSADFK